MNVRQMDLVLAILRELERQAAGDGEAVSVLPRQMNACVDAANLIVEAFNRPYRPATPGCGYGIWGMSDDTGLSSLWMAHVLTGKISVEFNYPHDADDFNRCVTFLKAVPESERAPLSHLSMCKAPWPALVAEWSALEAMLEGKEYEKLNARMKELGC
jgi:hypothetical protein